MVIATRLIQQAWIEDGFADTVIAYVDKKTAPFSIATVASNCTDSKGNALTYSQVVWALAFKNNNNVTRISALPESDSELGQASIIAESWS